MAKVSRFLNLILVLVIAGCAGQFPPSGGPVDKTPPQILFSSPSQKQLSFRSQKIILRFDKYMSERSVESAIYFPPYSSKDMDFDWSGKELDITLRKPLENDRTYILTIGATAIDTRNNYLGKAFSLVFSTGTQIDTGLVAGRIYAKKAQPYTVAAFPITSGIDTLRPSMNLAKYVTQSDDSGRYVMQGLAGGKYRLICFDDQMRNFTYAMQMDAYSSATHDIEITNGSQKIGDINFILGIEDTSRPQLYSADLARDGCLVLKFSEAIDTSSISPNDFVVRDSVTGEVFPVEYAARLEENKYDIVLWMRVRLPLKRTYLVTAKDSVKNLQSNRLSPESSTLAVKIDTATVDVTPYFFSFQDSLQNVTTYDTLFCQLVLRAAYGDSGKPEISLYDSTGNALPALISRKSENVFNVLTRNLNSLEWYTLKLRYAPELSRVTKDSVVVRHFRTIDFSTFGDVEGNVSPVILGERIIVVAVRKDGKTISAFAGTGGNFRLDEIPAGEYTISAYVQHGSTTDYFSGKSSPYEFAEPFGVYPDAIKVRARWTFEGVAIKLF